MCPIGFEGSTPSLRTSLHSSVWPEQRSLKPTVVGSNPIGGTTQLSSVEEQAPHKGKVTGSNPLAATRTRSSVWLERQSDTLDAEGSNPSEFTSRRGEMVDTQGRGPCSSNGVRVRLSPSAPAEVAQRPECLVANENVEGSNPFFRSRGRGIKPGEDQILASLLG